MNSSDNSVVYIILFLVLAILIVLTYLFVRRKPYNNSINYRGKGEKEDALVPTQTPQTLRSSQALQTQSLQNLKPTRQNLTVKPQLTEQEKKVFSQVTGQGRKSTAQSRRQQANDAKENAGQQSTGSAKTNKPLETPSQTQGNITSSATLVTTNTPITSKVTSSPTQVSATDKPKIALSGKAASTTRAISKQSTVVVPEQARPKPNQERSKATALENNDVKVSNNGNKESLVSNSSAAVARGTKTASESPANENNATSRAGVHITAKNSPEATQTSVNAVKTNVKQPAQSVASTNSQPIVQQSKDGTYPQVSGSKTTSQINSNLQTTHVSHNSVVTKSSATVAPANKQQVVTKLGEDVTSQQVITPNSKTAGNSRTRATELLLAKQKLDVILSNPNAEQKRKELEVFYLQHPELLKDLLSHINSLTSQMRGQQVTPSNNLVNQELLAQEKNRHKVLSQNSLRGHTNTRGIAGTAPVVPVSSQLSNNYDELYQVSNHGDQYLDNDPVIKTINSILGTHDVDDYVILRLDHRKGLPLSKQLIFNMLTNKMPAIRFTRDNRYGCYRLDFNQRADAQDDGRVLFYLYLGKGAFTPENLQDEVYNLFFYMPRQLLDADHSAELQAFMSRSITICDQLDSNLYFNGIEIDLKQINLHVILRQRLSNLVHQRIATRNN